MKIRKGMGMGCVFSIRGIRIKALWFRSIVEHPSESRARFKMAKMNVRWVFRTIRFEMSSKRMSIAELNITGFIWHKGAKTWPMS